MQTAITLKISELAKKNSTSTFLIVPEKFIDSLPVKLFAANRNISGYYTFTYGEIAEIAVRLSNASASVMKSEKRIGVFCKNPFLSLLTILALWESDVVPVMLNCLLTDPELRDELTLTETKQVILDSNLLCVDENSKYPVIELLSSKGNITPHTDETNVNPEQKSVYIFTSGSTGKPKAVEHSVRSLVAAFDSGNKFLGYNPNDLWLLSLPLFHISGLSVLLRTMLSGSALVISESGSVPDIIQAISNHPVTICSLVPTQLKRLIDSEAIPPKSLRFSLIGGGKADGTLLQKGSHWHPCPVYGMSETGAFVTALKPEVANLKRGSAGYILDGVQILILNEEMEPLASNETGEISIKSASLFNGYFNNENETAEKLFNGNFLTGDLGYIDEDGFLFITGRKIEVINSGGEKIHPDEIESLLLSVNGIQECCVLGIPHAVWGAAVTAVVSCKEGNQLTENNILRSLYKSLPSYKIPKRIIVLPELPKSALGKISREKLYEIVESLNVYPENQ